MGEWKDLTTSSVELDLDTRITTLEEQYELIQYYKAVTAGTEGTVTIPTGYTIELNRFAEGIDAVLTKEGTDSRPTDRAVYTTGGVIISTTLAANGTYTFSGTPSGYNVCIIYYLKGKRKYRENLSFDNIVETIEYTPREVHDDIQGILGTALTGAAQWTPTTYRNTGIVFNEITSGDYFTMVFQFPHRKKLSSNVDSIHLHYIPKAAVSGNIAFTYSWGWYNHHDVIPDTLPNTGTTSDIAILNTDQYKQQISTLVPNITFPVGEVYSSILYCRFVAVAPAAGVNYWTVANRIALVYMDAHYITDRDGSYNETTD